MRENCLIQDKRCGESSRLGDGGAGASKVRGRPIRSARFPMLRFDLQTSHQTSCPAHPLTLPHCCSTPAEGPTESCSRAPLPSGRPLPARRSSNPPATTPQPRVPLHTRLVTRKASSSPAGTRPVLSPPSLWSQRLEPDMSSSQVSQKDWTVSRSR